MGIGGLLLSERRRDKVLYASLLVSLLFSRGLVLSGCIIFAFPS